MIEYVNKGLCNLTGYSEEELLGESAKIFSSIDSENVTDYSVLWSDISKDKKWIGTFHNMKKNGDLYWESAIITPIYDNFGKKINYLAIKEDISEKVKIENDRLKSENRVRTMFDQAPLGIALIDSLSGKIVETNSNFSKILGWSREELFQIDWMSLAHPDDIKVHQDNMLLLINGDITKFRMQKRCIHKDNSIIWMNMTVTLFSENDTEKPQHLCMIEDITRIKKIEEDKNILQEQISHSNKMEAIGQLSGGIAHDLNNSLSGIIGASEVLLYGKDVTNKQKELIDMILTSAERAGELTKKLLLFSRKGHKLGLPVNMLEIINETVDLLEHSIDKNISISINNKSTKTMILGDDSMLQNMLMNLAINSSHAMPEGGEIVCKLENITLDSDYCKNSIFELEYGEYLRIDISDTGTGMSPDIQSHIFEPFFTTKDLGKGTGIGLSTVYGVVKDYKGEIKVSSKEGIGTVFHLFFPIVTTKSNISKERGIISGVGTILVIDDDELIRITSRAILESLGYKVLSAENGQIGVEIFLENADEIDLVLLDMIMPVMSGRVAFGKLREIDNNIPVIISTGFDQDSEMEKLKKLGVASFISKPFRRVELSKLISGILAPTDQDLK